MSSNSAIRETNTINPNATVFDIETGPLNKEWVLSLSDPFPPFSKPAPFDPSVVKIGNLKDQEKISEKIGAARSLYETECRNAYPVWLAEKEAFEADILSKSALDAATGMILVIGYKSADFEFIDEGREEILLSNFWDLYKRLKSNSKLISFYGHSFDLPFIVRRSLVNGIPIPADAIKQNRFWHDSFIDLAEIWSCGGRRAEDRINLDVLDRLLKGEGKQGSGADFSRLYLGSEAERQEALNYALTDTRITYRLAQKMGVI